MSKNLLLFSSSRVAETQYLEHALPVIAEFFADSNANAPIVFIPYAGVTISYEQYEAQVAQAFNQVGLEVKSVHRFKSQQEAIANAPGIVVGGGNTFALLNALYQENLLEPIKQHCSQGKPYVGWSAGSNIAGPTIKTTNDMPIVAPPSFEALSLIPWQVNPHYIDGNPPGHQGETRQQRLEEFLRLNPNAKVIGIAEGTAIRFQDDSIRYHGKKPGYVFNQQGKFVFQTSAQLAELVTN